MNDLIDSETELIWTIAYARRKYERLECCIISPRAAMLLTKWVMLVKSEDNYLKAG